MHPTDHAIPVATHAGLRSDPLPSPARPAPLAPALADDWALFLDVDGCLLELAETPDAVTVPAGLGAQLEVLRMRLGGALALVSGRAIAKIDMLFAPSRFAAAGLHGLERRIDGHDVVVPAMPSALPRIADEARLLATRYPGALIEDKGVALGLHWRQAPAAEAPLQAFAAQVLSRLPGYRLQQGRDVVELRPDGIDGHSIDKGSAIAAFLQAPPFAGRVPVFAGDDLTDESGFATVNTHGGISILVGERAATDARFRLRDPPAVRDWLGVPREVSGA
jgi:trehalose 6-phosphate phosphatase